MSIVRDSFYINGEWVKATSGQTLEVTSSGTGELYATIPAGTVEEADQAVEAAAAAFSAWANTSPKERGEFLVRISEKLAERSDREVELLRAGMAYLRANYRGSVRTTTLCDAAALPDSPGDPTARIAAAFKDLAESNALPLMHRYETRLHMVYQRALHNLLLLRAAVPNEPSPNNGQ